MVCYFAFAQFIDLLSVARRLSAIICRLLLCLTLPGHLRLSISLYTHATSLLTTSLPPLCTRPVRNTPEQTHRKTFEHPRRRRRHYLTPMQPRPNQSPQTNPPCRR